ncbi:putative neutral amino-acid efflux system, rhtB family (lysine, threonine, homoserine) [Cupriavidus taiwanensis]|uniref:Neutral amino-acid efflux system, rhtB family (Lysine, threonine, homoserine) n=1 Tax=Cupriavidus taiwanensis TaxID=164546 RepID=A0A375E713_9BURK|nr:LysE family transporter [Cupriavidus taiwanensis]SOZ14951.1 putative neutral amino-acid efflux system, rhtB family (lysine, threonine, homoserine) [Cupriavidus taiwanensis]SOZ26803.1 putative neutral amino-acid efflux system, rhtB family (lysine, threonine, homoserine) [Cupriavidus taiwanensis]SOZ45524.1 putative neutral amino-acid efflux system, rhtB family (lysine, threonine, homoserine) [Cupriavidus taiwanensis]SOZ59805.1 putative neutral amino-acid efflux system, rhtB family (lysine, thr
MRWEVWLAYFAACWVIAVSPGSGAVLSMSHGLSYGLRRTTTTIFGLQAGLVIVLLVAGGGLGALLLASEQAFMVVKTIGALYLIYLGIQQWRARVEADAGQDGGPVRVAVMSRRRRFATGLLTNVTNPKGIIFMVAVLPQFIDPNRPLAPQLAILAATMCAVDLVVMHGYALLASRMQGLFRNARAVLWQNRFFGSVLMAVGAALFFVRRQHA